MTIHPGHGLYSQQRGENVAFYSVLFQNPQQEVSLGEHEWMRLERAARGGNGARVVRGNKLIRAESGARQEEPAPVIFNDLNLKQVMEAVFPNGSDEPLRKFFFMPVPNEQLLAYRSDVMRNLQEPSVRTAFADFQSCIGETKRCMLHSKQVHHSAQKSRYALDAAAAYCAGIQKLCRAFDSLPLWSEGLARFAAELRAYESTEEFTVMRGKIRRAISDQNAIGWQLCMYPDRIELFFQQEKTDYAREIQTAFCCGQPPEEGMSRTGADIRLFRQLELSPLEVKVIEGIQQKYSGLFSCCRELAEQTEGFFQEWILRFCQELCFYQRYADFMQTLQARGFPFAYAQRAPAKEIRMEKLYDIALASGTDAASVVPNDFDLREGESGAIITGANQGGKTTFARSFGQAAYLMALGLPVPCKSARLPLYERFFTQFSKAEDSLAADGKLNEELARLKHIFKWVNSSSLVILNELFSSATAQDALEMGRQAVRRIAETGATALCVWHLPELASMCPELVSFVAQVEEGERRTYKINRAPADGLAYAQSIARKYGLTRSQIKERITHGI